MQVAFRRDDYQQQVGEQAIVFKLKRRPREGVILTAEEIRATGYEFGLLTRTERYRMNTPKQLTALRSGGN
jgi:uncharacterized protein DUF1874